LKQTTTTLFIIETLRLLGERILFMEQYTLYENARILTLDKLLPHARAMLISKGVILSLFEEEHPVISGLGAIRRVDCQNLVMMPAFTDSHVHLMDTGRKLEIADLSSARSENEAVSILHKASINVPRGDWIQGSRWAHNLWTPPALPTKKSLDAAFPHNPVFLPSKCGHLIWVNSCALKMAEMTRETPDPAGGRIDKDPLTGEPTGIIKENYELICRAIPPISDQRKREFLKKSAAHFNRFGIAHVHTIDAMDDFFLLQEMRRSADFTLNAVIYVPDSSLENLILARIRSGFGDDNLRFGGIKSFVDGSLGGRTAWMEEPFEEEPDNTGINMTPPKTLLEMIEKANTHGISVMTHAIGDLAVLTILDIYSRIEKSLSPSITPPFRNRVEHFQILSEKIISRLPHFHGVASVQPVHILSDWRPADQFWGVRSRFAYAFRTLRKFGFPLVFGSDSPVEPINPFWGLYASVQRKDLEGHPDKGWFADESLTILEALQAYCTEPPMIVGEGSRKGSLSPGKRADFILVDHDLLAEDPEIWKNTRIFATAVSGEIVFQEI
jgi:hypothetical protein